MQNAPRPAGDAELWVCMRIVVFHRGQAGPDQSPPIHRLRFVVFFNGSGGVCLDRLSQSTV